MKTITNKATIISILVITFLSLTFYFYAHDKFYDGIDTNNKNVKIFIFDKKAIDLNSFSLFDGKAIMKFDDGNISTTIDIRGGIRNGFETSYYPSGIMKSQKYMKNNVNDGEFKYWYENGVLRATGYSKDGKADGVTTEFYPSGAIKLKRYMKNGLGNGEIKVWYENGILNLSGQLKNGKQEGTITEFYSNGNKRREATYNQDVLVGKHFIYHKNGTLWFKSTITNGQPDNIQEFDETGEFKGFVNEIEVKEKWKTREH